MSKYFDFDQFREENKKKPVVIKIFGKEEELPPALPAGIMLDLMSKTGALSTAEAINIAIQIFGADRLSRWCKEGLDTDDLEVLITKTMQMYQGNKEEVKSKGNGKSAKK